MSSRGNDSARYLSAQYVFSRDLLTIEEQGEYAAIRYEGARVDDDPRRAGAPGLPYLGHHFALPPDTYIDSLRVTVVSADTLEGRYTPPPIRGGDQQPSPPDPERYDSAYPPHPAVAAGSGKLQNYHLGSIMVYPVQYLGETSQLVLIESVQVEVVLRSPTAEESSSAIRRNRPDQRPPSQNAELQWVLRTVDNPDDFERDYLSGRTLTHGLVEEERPFGGFVPTEFPSLEGPPVELVILTDTLDVGGNSVGDLVAEFQELAEWRTKSGMPTVIKTVSWVADHYPGVDRPEQIRNFLKEAFSQWGTRFVCLGGDVDIVPTRFVGAPDGVFAPRPDQPADAYYSELDGTWNGDDDAYWFEFGTEFGWFDYLDLWIGRLPARDADQARAIVRKILEYERAPGHAQAGEQYGGYYSRYLFAAGLTNSPLEGSDDNGVNVSEDIIANIEANSIYPSDICRMYCVAPDLTPTCGGSPQRCFEHLYDVWTNSSPAPVPFSGPALRDSLESGFHLVFHVEHSYRDQLGSVSDGTNLMDESCESGAWKSACFEAYKDANVAGIGNPLVREMADGLGNGPRYSLVFSCGSYTNQWDLDAIGERFLRAPRGGAIAYFGKNASSDGLAGSLHNEILMQGLEHDVAFIGATVGLALNGSFPRIRKANTWNLLADPSLPVWGETPDTLLLSQSPGTITTLGTQTIVIEVRSVDVATGDTTLVENARVCLKQGDAAYAVAWSDAQGEATFHSYALNSNDAVSVTASKRNCVPKKANLKFGSLSSLHHLTYDRHSRDDWVTGDGDDVLESGETQRMRVVARDNGSDVSSTGDLHAYLWPTAPIICDLKIEGASDPDRIFLGGENAHPPFAVQDTFRIPANWEAIRLEGEPDGTIGTGGMYVHMWRDTTAVYHIKSKTYPTSADSLVTGILRTRGGFSDVSWDAETGAGPDSVYFDPGAPDSIWFQFARDGSDDELFFRAESADWIQVLTDSVSLGTTAAGDTASGAFDVEFTGAIPDREEVVFTLAVREEHESWWFSDFSETVRSPEVRLLASKPKYRVAGVVYLDIFPTISNLGSATADTSIAILTVQSGSSTLIDGDVTFSAVAPGDTLKASQSFKLSAPNQAAHDTLRYALEIRTYHPNGDSTLWVREDLDVQAPSAVTGLITDEMNGAVVLRWNKSAASDLEGYHVFQSLPGSLTRLTRQPVTGTSRYEVSGLDALGGGAAIDYRYAVTAADISGNESSKAWSDTAHVWLREKPGWPKRIPSGSATAVKAADVDGDGYLEIFAAGRKIHAWNHDGTPLLSGNEDGLFYDPRDDGQAAGDSSKVFVQSLALGDLDADGNWEVVGNVARDGLYVVEYSSGSVSGRWQKDGWVSRLSPPILANLDPANGDSVEVILMDDGGGTSNPSAIYVWNEDGSTWSGFGSLENDVGGSFLHRSVAVADVVPDTAGLEIVQAVQNPATGPSDRDKVYCWNGISGRLLWEADVPGARGDVRLMSCPILADVDDNDTLDVVLTRPVVRDGADVEEPGGVFILSWRESGGSLSAYTVAHLEDDSFEFTGTPPVPPVVANFDADDSLEVAVPGGTYSSSTANGEDTAKMHVFDLQPNGTLDETVASVDIPIPGRKFSSMHSDWTPVVADIDGDGNLEILSPTTHAWMIGWEWKAGTLAPERGWPMLFPDVPSSPLIADADGGGDLELIVQDYSGLVHMLELAGDTLSVREWWQFGGDAGNRFQYEGPRTGPAPRPDLEPELPILAVDIVPAGPNPFGEESRVSLRLPAKGKVRVSVFDVQGRRVRTLVDGELEAGAHTLVWDGRSDHGRKVASGVFFYVLEAGGRTEVLKAVRIRAGGAR